MPISENWYFNYITLNAEHRQLTCVSPTLLLSVSGGSSVVFFCAIVASHKNEISLQNKIKEGKTWYIAVLHATHVAEAWARCVIMTWQPQHRFHAISESQSCFENISFRSQTQIVPVFKMLSPQKIPREIVIISVGLHKKSFWINSYVYSFNRLGKESICLCRTFFFFFIFMLFTFSNI